ncbi:MAG: hypothetical protein ACPGSD_17390 [Flavobacteriales bacterium]
MNESELLEELVEFVNDIGYYSEFIQKMVAERGKDQDKVEDLWDEIQFDIKE